LNRLSPARYDGEVTRLAPVLVLAGALAAAQPAAAQTYRLVAPDGTVHFTNAPTDPRYQRLGVAPAAPMPARPAPAAQVRPVVTSARPGSYDSEIREAAERYGVPERLISAVIRVESAFNPRAVSPKGAQGLMQLMPETASMLGVRDVFDPRANIDGGVRHLRGLLEHFADISLALAAYNAGAQAVAKYGGIPPYPETRDYVARILGLVDGMSLAADAFTSSSTFRRFDRDGAVVYTNIPPRL
jgi:soluble lytic murein transglycosylase-like protein